MHITSSDLTRQTKEFFSVFDAYEKQHIIEYYKHLSGLNAAVVVLMARKAACLYRCFEILGLVRRSSVVTTDRVLAFNRSWLAGKSVALVDDALISGTSLFRTRNQLLGAGSTVKTHTFFINQRWHAKSLIEPDHNFLKLDDSKSSQLSANLVDAMSVIPRAYSIDYPLYNQINIPAHKLSSLQMIPGWDCLNLTTELQRQHGVFSYTLHPDKIRLRELNNCLGWHISEKSLCKIRIYGRNFGDNISFVILPIVALGPVTRSDIDSLFQSTVDEYPTVGEQILTWCNTGSAKFQLLQFIAANRLTRLWTSRVFNLLKYSSLELSLDIDELGLLFPPALQADVVELCSTDTPLFQNAKASTINFSEPKKQASNVKNAFEAQEVLSDQFTQIYFEKELSVRTMVKELGVRAYDDAKHGESIDRLRYGFTVPDLIACLPENIFYDRERLVSKFLDIAIDRGAVVPISAKFSSTDGVSNDIYYRGYRHGEEVIVTLREEKLLLCMLTEFVSTLGSSDPISATWMEKLLVIFIKCGIYSQFLNPFHGELKDADDRFTNDPIIGVTYYLHGAVTQQNIERIYNFDTTASFLKMLCRRGRIRSVSVSAKKVSFFGYEKKAYEIGPIPDIPANTKDENLAKRLGRRLGELASIRRQKDVLLNIDKLTLIASCLTPEDSLSALTAELYIFSRFWQLFQHDFRRVNEKTIVCKMAEELRKQFTEPYRAWTSINNGRWKYKASRRGEPVQIIKDLGDYLGAIDIEKAESWYDFWPNLNAREESEDANAVNLNLINAGDAILALNILIRIWITQISTLYPESKLKRYDEIELAMIANEVWEPNRRNSLKVLYSHLLPPNGLCELHVNETVDAICRQVKRSYKFSTFVKKVVESKGKLKKVTYFPYSLCVFFTDSDSEGTKNIVISKIYSLVDGINDRLRTNPAPKMYKQRQRATTSGDTDERYFRINLRGKEKHFIQISARGSDILQWLIHLMFRLEKELPHKEAVRFAIFSGLPKHLQPFLIEGDGQIENGEFGDIISCGATHALQRQEQVLHLYMKPEEQSLVSKEISEYASGCDIEESFLKVSIENFYEEFSINLFSFTRNIGMGKAKTRADVGIVLITPRELRGVQRFLAGKGEFQRGEGKHSKRTYLKAKLDVTSTNSLTLIATQAIEQGQQSVMSAVQSLATEAQPRIIVLLGIAGAIDKSLELGDVVLATNVIFYEDRVETGSETIRRLNSKKLPAWSLSKTSLFFADHGEPAYLISENGKSFKAIPAPIGSGEAIIKAADHEIREYLKKLDYRTAAIEKEAIGFLQYFFESSLEDEIIPDGILIVRGISDAADQAKDDSYQEIAAFNCMVVLHELLKSIGPFEDQ